MNKPAPTSRSLPTATLVWVLAGMGLAAGAVTLVLVRSALFDVQIQRARIEAVSEAMADLDLALRDPMSEAHGATQELIFGHEATPIADAAFVKMRVATESVAQRINDPEMKRDLQELSGLVQQVGKIQSQCAAWNTANRAGAAELDQARRAVEARLAQLQIAIITAQGRQRLALAEEVQNYRRTAGSAASAADAQHIVNNIQPSQALSGLKGEVANVSLLCARLAAAEDISSLADLRGNQLEGSFWRLRSEAQRTVVTPEFDVQMQAGVAALQEEIFGKGCAVDDAQQTIHPGAGGLYAACRARLETRLTQQALEVQLVRDFGRFNEVRNELDALSDAVTNRMAAQPEASLTATWHKLLLVGIICAGCFTLLALAIGRTIRKQVQTIELTNRSLDSAMQQTQAAADSLGRSEERFRTIVDTALDAVISIDGRGSVTGWNKQAHTIFGWSAEDALGRILSELIVPPHLRAEHAKGLLAAALTGQGRVLDQRIEVPALHRDGHEIMVELAVAPIRTAEGFTFSAFVRDITQRKHDEQELQSAKEIAERANLAKSEFLAHMSHEIRTPLNGVIGMTSLLLGTQLNERQRHYAELAKSSGQSLSALINDILDFSKIEAGKLEFEHVDFDLHEVVEDVIEVQAARALEKGLELACNVDADVPARVRSDPQRLKQVLMNLVNNAVKFTQKGEVVVRVTCTQSTDERALIKVAVRDSGIGMAPERMNRLFQSFSQLDASTTRKYGGTGLGLAISKRLVEMMGGQIGADSQEGQGSTFWFTAWMDKQAAVAAPAPTVTPAGLRVLVAEGNATSRGFLRDVLRRQGMDVHEAADAPAALALLQSHAAAGKPVDLAIIDAKLPDMDAASMAAAARQGLRRTALMALLPLESPIDAARLKAAGFAGYLIKPVRQSQVFDAVMDVLAGHGADLAQTQTPAPTPAPAAPGEKPRRVLLAEDNHVNQIVAQAMLAGAGYECDVVTDGQQALDAVFAKPYDAVLMDCQMPVMDGFESARAIRRRELETGGHVPIIALTANAMSGDRERCLAAGMDAYVSKPIDPRELTTALQATRFPAQRSSPSEAAPLDVEKLLERCANNAAAAQSALAEFEKQLDRDLTALAQNLKSGDLDASRRIAHALRGAAANMTATPLSALVAQLEALIHAGHTAAAQDLTRKVQEEGTRCRDFLPQAQRRLSQA